MRGEKEYVYFEEIRQYFYCKRIIFFREVMGFKGYSSYKMNKGKEYHEKKFKRKERIEEKNMWKENNKKAIAGYVDYRREKEGSEEKIIGDYKQKEPFGGKIPKHYKMQLVAEAIAENEEEINHVEIRLPKGRRIIERIEKEEIEEVTKAIKAIKSIKKEEILPEETKEKGKCKNCEYKNICQPI
ncbi:MAG: CRISPR-associated protein Cas4 [Candidatus Heimdallarchaeaceae archaeon]